MEEEKKITCANCGEEFNELEITYDYNSNPICKDCLEDRYFKCDSCGEYVPQDLCYRTHDNKIVCDACMSDDKVFTCDDCGEIWDRVDMTYIQDCDSVVCPDCADNYVCCDHCGELTTQDRPIYDGGYACSSCADDYYYCCESCGTLVHPDDVSSDGDSFYCPDCYDDECVVKGYHYHHGEDIPFYNDPVDDNDNETYDIDNFQGGYGFELEVDDGSNRNAAASEFQDYLGDHCYFEEDGSLSDDGFEIISAPHTRKAMEELYPKFQSAFKELKRRGYRSHDAEHCGLHIHASRALFGNNETERTENIAKMILFYEIFWDDLVKVSRRRRFNYCYRMSAEGSSWYSDMSVKSKDITEDDAKKIAKGEDSVHQNRYYSINLTNDNTVEFRLMRGTLNFDTFIATLDLTMTLVENCKKIPMDKITDKTLWLDGIKDYTVAYLKKRKAFGYTDDIQEDEEGADDTNTED